MQLDGWLTIAEAADRVGKSDVTIRRWIRREGITPLAGRVSEERIVAISKRMDERKGGRPRKP